MRLLAAVAVLLPMIVSRTAVAQSGGDDIVQIGWMHLHALDQAQAVRTHVRPGIAGAVLGVPESFDSPGTALAADDTDTLGISYVHFFSDHWALELEAGIPPVVDVRGRGTVAVPGAAGLLVNLDLGDRSINPIGSARLWSPALLVQWRPGNDRTWWARPFLGVGFTYAWFTQVDPGKNFSRAVDRRMGSVLAAAAGKPGPTRVAADIDSAFAPVVNCGVSVTLTQRLSLVMGAAWVPLSTDATLDVRAQDGTRLARARSRADADAVVTGVLLAWAI